MIVIAGPSLRLTNVSLDDPESLDRSESAQLVFEVIDHEALPWPRELGAVHYRRYGSPRGRGQFLALERLLDAEARSLGRIPDGWTLTTISLQRRHQSIQLSYRDLATEPHR